VTRVLFPNFSSPKNHQPSFCVNGEASRPAWWRRATFPESSSDSAMRNLRLRFCSNGARNAGVKDKCARPRVEGPYKASLSLKDLTCRTAVCVLKLPLPPCRLLYDNETFNNFILLRPVPSRNDIHRDDET